MCKRCNNKVGCFQAVRPRFFLTSYVKPRNLVNHGVLKASPYYFDRLNLVFMVITLAVGTKFTYRPFTLDWLFRHTVLFNKLTTRIYSSCIFVPHRWIMLFVRSDWLVRKWIASTILLLAADETKWCVKSLISDHFSVYWKKLTNFFTFLCGIYNFSLKCRWRWWIFTSTSVYSC